MHAKEYEEGITYAELGIDTSRCRDIAKCTTTCPQCSHLRKPHNQSQKCLTVNVPNGTMTCSHCGWKSALGTEARERGKKGNGMQSYVSGYQPKRQVVDTKPAPTMHTATPVAPTELHAGVAPWALEYLAQRGISAATAQAFKLGSHATEHSLQFPYYVDGALVNVKTRIQQPNGAKRYAQVKDAARCLFNVDRAEGEETIIHAEGEMDVLACHEVGWVAVSLPDGSPGRYTNPETGEVRLADVGAKDKGLYEDKSARVMAAARRIILMLDDDLEGHKMRDHLRAHYGPARCWEVTYPKGCKDANEVLVKYGADVLDQMITSARPSDLDGVRDFRSEFDALDGIYEYGYDQGAETGWPELDAHFRPRQGTVTVVSGIPGTGKTSFTYALFGNLAHLHGWKFGIFSPESGESGTLLAKLCQIAGGAAIMPGVDARLTRDELHHAREWVADHFWRVDSAGLNGQGYSTVDLPEIIARLESLVLRHGIHAAIIDPWNRLEASRPGGMTETEYVAYAINMISRFAQRHHVAVFVVAHPHKMDPKGDGEDSIPAPYQIAGSAHWFNMADYILGVGRNKFEEPRNRAIVQIQKVREEGVSGELGTVYFYHDARSRRFYADQSQIPLAPGTEPFSGALPRMVPTVPGASFDTATFHAAD